MTFHAFNTRVGSVRVDTFAPTVDTRFAWRRGRCREREIRIPLTREWTLQLSSPGKSYRQLVGAPKELENLDWILDEFDHNFNALASASLRYHLDYSVCDNSNQRGAYEDIIARLNEPEPRLSEEDMDYLHPPGSTVRDYLAAINFDDPRRTEIYAEWNRRRDEWRARVDQARHDFVDVMRGLWS